MRGRESPAAPQVSNGGSWGGWWSRTRLASSRSNEDRRSVRAAWMHWGSPSRRSQPMPVACVTLDHRNWCVLAARWMLSMALAMLAGRTLNFTIAEVAQEFQSSWEAVQTAGGAACTEDSAASARN